MNTIGERIKYLRKLQGLTTEQLADVIGMKKGSVSSYENNRYDPSAKTIVSICKQFDVSADWLLTGEGRGPKEEAPPLDDEAKEKIKKYIGYAASVGKKIRHIRIQKKFMSEAEFAQAIDVTTEDLVEYEAGRKTVSACVLHKISDRFDINPAYLVDPEEESPQRRSISSSNDLTEFEKNILHFFKRLPRDEREEISEIVMMKHRKASKKGQLSNSINGGEEEQAATKELA
jgi:transcriptional regulator with XRE-family HTH domain